METTRQLLSLPIVFFGTVLMVVEKMLMLLVQVYDVIVYSPLQSALWPVVKLIPRQVTVHGRQLEVFTANIVSWSRTVLVIPIAISLKYGMPWVGFWLVMLHDFLDHLDGIVAKVQRQTHPGADDPLLGGFMDAFCDKIVNVLALWSILMVTDVSRMTTLYSLAYILACCVIIGYEFTLGIVRVQDYFRGYYFREFYGEAKQLSGSGESTAAVMVGKLKEKLESVGIACLCLAHASGVCTAGLIGVSCLLLSIRLAHASLTQKLESRKTARQKPSLQPVSSVDDLENSLTEKASEAATSDEEGEKADDSTEKPFSDSSEEEKSGKFDKDENGNAVIKYRGKSKRDLEENQFNTKDTLDNDSYSIDTDYQDNRNNLSLPIYELDNRVEKAYTVGCFDLFHVGHVILLQRMRAIAKEVIVGVHCSRSIYALKKRVPIDSTEVRMKNVKKHADVVFCVAGTDPTSFIYCAYNGQKGSSVYVRGDDMPDFPARKLCEELMEVRFFSYTEGVSSTKLRKHLLNSSKPPERFDNDIHLFY